jgi:predicted DNA-binding transcriptional regulator AlpA
VDRRESLMPGQLMMTLDEIARDPAKAAGLPVEVRGPLIVQAAAVLAVLGVGLTPPTPTPQPMLGGGDRYLTMEDVRARMGLSRSHLYQLARTGGLPVRPLGRRRGYRVLLSDLLAWEQDRPKNAVDERLNRMLSVHHGRQGVSTPSRAPRSESGRARGEDRGAQRDSLALGDKPQRHPGARRPTDPAPQAGHAAS